jgi:hypothetical protein
MNKNDIRDKARCNLAMAEAMRRPGPHGDDVVLEAFMATFYPEKQRDRDYMNRLHAATRR